MAKHIVKAVRHKNQIRITIPAQLQEEMGWREAAIFILEKISAKEVKITQLYRKKDMD